LATVSGNIMSVGFTSERLAMIQGKRGRAYLSTFAMPSGAPLRTRFIGTSRSADNLSADGRFLVTAGNYTAKGPASAPIRVWSVPQGKVLRTFAPAIVTYAAFSPDGSRLLLEEGASQFAPGYLVIENAHSGHAVRLQTPPTCVLQQAQYAFSANNKFVAAAAFCGFAVVWNAATGKLIRQVTQGGETSAVALSTSGARMLVSSWDSRATIWSVATGRPLMQFVGHTSGIANAALSPDGSLVATSGLDNTVRLWNAYTGQELRLLAFPTWQWFLAFSPSGAQFAVAKNTPIQGVVDYAQVYDACPDCTNARGLLATAKRLAIPASRRTTLENTVISRS
jgi:WD40 repeat protein